MSQQVRQALVNDPHLIFQNDQHRLDLLKEGVRGQTYSGTQTELIAFLAEMLKLGHIIETTMIQTGHHDDGPKGHAGGNGCDCWPLASATPGDYLEATDPRFAQFLFDAGKSEWRYQIGLVGDGADSDQNFHYAIKGCVQEGNFVYGLSVFQDDGGAHVHLGANGF